MKPSPLPALLLAAALLLATSSHARAAVAVEIPGELIVKFKLGATAATRAAALARVPNSSLVHELAIINAEHVRFSGMTTAQAIARMQQDPLVVYAEPNYEIHLEAIPNDPRFPELWGMRNVGQTGGTPGADIRATQAWDQFTGDPNLKIGVIDTGVDWTHPDLAGNIWTNPGEIAGNGLDDDGNGYVDDIHGYDFVNNDGNPMDDNGHGTHCSGTIAGVGNNGVGVAGVNWHCRIVGIKFLSAGGGGSTAGAISAVQYAVAVGVRLTSNSWGGGAFSTALLDAINAAGGSGQLFVAAAGNAGSDNDLFPHYPAAYDSPFIIAVAATDHNDLLAGFSNWGHTSVDLGAPGVDILSSVPGAGYALLSGTSMATPHVAGATALVMGRFPDATNLQIKELVLASTDSIPSLAGRVVSNGRLNVFRAIEIPDSIPPGAISDLATGEAGSTAIDLAWTARGDDGDSGRVARYDIRYSTSPIDTGNFAAATPAPGVGPAPGDPGTSQTFEVTGLAYNTTYFFALKAVDEFGNASELSNVVTGTTFGIPNMAVSPASFTEDLLTGGTASQTLTVSNTGTGRLDFVAPTPVLLGSPPRQWLSVTPGSGRIPAGGSMELTVGFDATALFGGDYLGAVVLLGNDPDLPQDSIPASLHVTGAPDIAVSADSLDFGALFIGATRVDSLVVTNAGTDLLTVTGVTISPGDYTVPGAGFALPPGGNQVLPVTFSPASAAVITGTLVLASNDHDEGLVTIPLKGEGLIPPDVSLAPDSLAASLLTGETTTRTITVTNSGGSDLVFETSVVGIPLVAPAPVPPLLTFHQEAHGPTLNQTQPHSGAPVVRALYSGTHLHFGITEYGEIMPYQFPVGNEHLAWGAYVSGYTLAWVVNGVDNLAYAAHDSRYRILPVSYQEVENTPARVIVEVVTRTDDGALTVHRRFTFRRDRAYVRVESTVQNASGSPVSQIVLKESADWDVDGNFYNTWDYDHARNMAYAWNQHYAAIAANRPPDFMDVNGWNDYTSRATVVDYPAGPVANLDGLEVLHFELGRLGPSQSIAVTTAYGAANSLAELQAVMDEAVNGASWLTVAPPNGTVPAGGSRDLLVTFNAAGLFGGDYRAEVHVASNDPDEPYLSTPAALHVTGAPDIAATPDSLDYGALFIGATRVDSVVVTNEGTDLLGVTGVTISPGDYTVPGAGFVLSPGARRVLPVGFSPASAAVITGTLVLASNDPDEGVVTIPLRGEGLVPPDVSVAPDSLAADLVTGETAISTVTITNSGSSDLLWTTLSGGGSVLTSSPVFGATAAPSDKVVSTEPPAPPAESSLYRSAGPANEPLASLTQSSPTTQAGTLADALASLNAGFAEITAAIPSRYDFSDGEFGNYIEDGGDDMYDGGNFLWTEFGGLDYSNNAIIPSPAFGTGGQYFTRKYPGLFVLAADQQGVSSFAIGGNLGADGGGSVYGSILQMEFGGATYRAFVKRVYNAFDPSVNHMVIVADEPGATHAFATNTDDDFHQVSGLAASHRIYYLLYAGQLGGYIGDADALEIFSAFLRVLRPSPAWLTSTPDSGVTAPGQTSEVQVTFNATGLFGGDYRGAVHVLSNDPDEPDLAVTATLHVTGAPDITVTPDSLLYGQLFIGGSRVDTVVVTNDGTDLLTVASVSASPGDFTVPGAGFALAPGASRELPVTFAPAGPGVRTGALVISSDDPDEGAVSVFLQGNALVPPDVSLAPDSLSADLFSGQTTTRTMTITNSGGSDLTFELFATETAGPAPPAAGPPVSLPASLMGPTLNDLPSLPAAPVAQAIYAGTHLQFGITAFGEVMPYQFPVGNEHLAIGTYLSGYTLAYFRAGVDRIAFAMNYQQSGLVPESYQELENSPARVVVEVVTRTADSALRVRRLFTFPRDKQYLRVETSLLNTAGAPLSQVVFKEEADWDVDGNYTDDSWNYDHGRNMAYAWTDHYVAIAADRTPDAMDIGGWNDVTQRTTIVDVPVGPVFFYDGLEVLHFELGSLAPLETDVVTVAYGAGNTLTDLQRVMDEGVRGGRWLSFSPPNGSVPAGTSQDVIVTFDASGLFGGDYRADIHVASNDPDETDLTMPAHLHVTGAGELAVAPDSLGYGTLFVGQSRVDTVVVTNVGTDLLTVSGVTASPGAYTVPGGGFALAPGVSHALAVTFAPASAGTFPGSLVIASDDPTDPSVTVTLSGTGTMPPVMNVAPDSLAFALLSGGSTSAILRVTNDGESELAFDVSRVMIAGLVQSASATAMVRDLSDLVPPASSGEWSGGSIPGQRLEDLGAGVRSAVTTDGPVLVVAGTDVNGSILRALNELGETHSYIFTTNFAAIDYTPYSTVIVGLDGGSPSVLDIQALAIAASAGRKLIMFGGTAALSYYTGLQNYLLTHTGAIGWTIPPPPHLRVLRPTNPLAFGLPGTATYVNSGAANYMVRIADSAAVVVADNGNNHPTLVDKSIGDGELIYFTGSPYTGYWTTARDFSVFKQVLRNALAGGASSWLSVNPEAGTVAPHSSMDLVVGADATGLIGGTYFARLRIASNDPVRPEVSVPVSLVVTGAPNITVSRDTLLYAATFVGQTRVDTVEVTNTGTDLLSVSHVVTSPAYFSASTAGFDLAPGESRPVLIAFLPDHAGVLDGSIVFYTNDPDAAAFLVRLDGLGVTPPVVAVVPGALNAVLPPDAILDQGLVIENHGGSPLTWSLQVGTLATAAVVAHLPAAPSAMNPPAPDEKEQGGTPDPGPLMVWSATTLGSSGAGALRAVASAAGALEAAATLPLSAVLGALDSGYTTVTSRIPSRYNFTEGVTGTLISDGGDDMYDGGNTLSTNLGGPVTYSNGVITFAAPFGANYFTRKHPGLFVLVADLAGVSNFTINGNLGADGVGNVDAATLEISRGATHYSGFVKRVYGTMDPSVNHLIIVADAPGVSHSYSNSTDSDFDQLSALTGVSRVYYLLFARTSGGYVDNATMLDIMGAFIDLIGPPAGWLSASPTSGTVPAHGSTPLTVRYDSHGLAVGSYAAQLAVSSNDPLAPLVSVPVGLEVSTAATAGVEGPEGTRFALHGVFPNPPARDVSVAFSLPDAAPASLDLLDLAGRRLKSLDVGSRGAGRHVVTLGRAGSLPSGVYLIRLTRAGRSLVTKCVVMR